MIETNTLPFVVSVYPYLCQSICQLIRQSVCLSVPSVYPPIFGILTRKVFFSEPRERPCWLATVDSAPQTAPPQSETWHFRGLDYVDLTIYCGAKD